MDILDKARELGEMIAESKQMDEFNKAEEAVENDAKAKELFDQYKSLQLDVVKAAKSKLDQTIIDEMRAKLMEKQKEINEYSTTGRYLETKSAVDALMKNINSVIMHTVTGEESCSSGSCSSCSGCK